METMRKENEEKHLTLGELIESGRLGCLGDYLFSNMTDDVWNNTLEHYGYETCSLKETLDRAEELGQKKETLISLYSEEDRNQMPEKAAVKLVYMPAQEVSAEGSEGAADLEEAAKPYVLVCPGGGYARQWGMIEGLAIGARLNKLGYPAFVLYYRTAQKPLLPKPMEDVAAAVSYLEANKERYHIQTEGYAVAGFSAGAHLAAEWGTKEEGARHFGLTQPGCLFLGYPAISTDSFVDGLERLLQEEVPNTEAIASSKNFLERVSGLSFTRESLRRYSIDLHIDRAYPEVFLVACKDDPIVPIESSIRLKEALKAQSVACHAEIAEQGGHSFGVGDGGDLDGWLWRAVSFWRRER